MKNIIKKVKEFNSAFGLPINGKPTLGDFKQCRLRYDLMSEELDEYWEACNVGLTDEEKGLTEVADALTDELYILVGKFIFHGMDSKLEALFNEVHSSNMSKLDNNGKAIYREDGKVMKSDNFREPELLKILNDGK